MKSVKMLTSLQDDKHDREGRQVLSATDDNISEHGNLFVEVENLEKADRGNEADGSQNHQEQLHQHQV